MRWVYEHAEDLDRTPGHKNCRRWLRDNPKGFLSQMSQLERALIVAQIGSGPETPDMSPVPEPAPIDQRTERVLGLCEQLLADFEAKQAKEDAELARRPNAAEIAATLQHRLAGALEREERLRCRVQELESQVSQRLP